MTSGDLAIIGGMVGSSGGLSTSEADGWSLYSVSGQAVSGGTSECTPEGFSIGAGNIYILTGVPLSTMAPTLEWVEINGVPFHNGDILSAHCDVVVGLSDERGVATIELTVIDPPNTTVPFTLVSGNTFEGTWRSSFMVRRGKSRSVPLHFYTKDSDDNAWTYNIPGRIVGGAVTVVGRAYNYPNPFKPMSGGTTNIQYVLSQDAAITLIIYDTTGHEVKRMKFGSGATGGRGGTNQVAWNGKTFGERVVSDGMYFYKIISGNEVIGSGKLVVLD